jgi:hypothetical protein
VSAPNTYDGYIQKELQGLSEQQLQSRIIEPLLRAMGFDRVRDVSGPNEAGKDLIGYKDDFHPVMYAIQIKKLKVTGKVASPKSLPVALTQLEQAIREPIFDPVSKEDRVPDKVILITPFAVQRHVFMAARNHLRELSRRNIELVDGPMLADLVRKHIPTVLSTLSIEVNYRLSVEKTHNAIAESAAAFQLSDSLQLDALFVDIQVDCFASVDRWLNELLFDFKQGQDNARRGDVASPFASWFATNGEALIEEWRIALSAKQHSEHAPETAFFSLLLGSVQDAIRSIADLDSESADDRLRQESGRRLLLFQRSVLATTPKVPLQVGRALSSESILLLQQCQGLVAAEEPMVSSRYLHRCSVNLLIVGGAGAGKTTLLRRFAQRLAHDTDVMPVFIRFIDIETPSAQSILDTARQQMERLGMPFTRSELMTRLRDGRVRLLLDGLDEVADRLSEFKTALLHLSRDLAEGSLIVSSRHPVAFDEWQDAVCIRLAPFGDSQLRSFIENWFGAQPSLAKGLVHWLEQHPKMKESARTPLIAALLCSIYGHDTNYPELGLPTTERDLYQGRLELLLGKWERAKGIRPLAAQISTRYQHFLMDLAYEIHLDGRRDFTVGFANTVAARYFIRDYHKTVESLVVDCIDRGILFRGERDHNLSFGHLTYQEYLVGEWLARHNPLDTILQRLNDDWWWQPLLFYAARVENIGDLLTRARASDNWERLRAMSTRAPMTPTKLLLGL